VTRRPEEMSSVSPSTGPPEEPTKLRIRERGRARRRLRYLRRLRELQLRDAGGFVFDLFRFGERRDALVREKLDALIATDKEIRHLEALLGVSGPPVEIRQPGVGGTCPSCGAFHGSDARFCAHCGVELKTAASPPAPAEEAAPTEEPTTEEPTTAEEPAAEDDGEVPIALPEEIVAERIGEEAAEPEVAANGGAPEAGEVAAAGQRRESGPSR
jgi:zinc-ribbon domain